jgi:hypothetical protein
MSAARRLLAKLKERPIDGKKSLVKGNAYLYAVKCAW